MREKTSTYIFSINQLLIVDRQHGTKFYLNIMRMKYSIYWKNNMDDKLISLDTKSMKDSIHWSVVELVPVKKHPKKVGIHIQR